MKATELMIGDWVLYRGYPHRVKEIYPRLVSLEAQSGIDAILGDFAAFIEDIQPIPLTPEILEKNGIKLEEVGDSGVSTPPKWRNRFEKWVLRTQWRDAFIWYDRTAKYWHLHDMGAAKLLYVHQLQHAFELCEVEKEVLL